MKLSISESYLAMFWFIDSFYWKTKDDDLGSILGGLSPFTFMDDTSADPAAWSEWKTVIEDMNLKDENKKNLTIEETIKATVVFLKEYNRSGCFNLDIIYENISALQSENCSKEVQEQWDKAVQKSKKM